MHAHRRMMMDAKSTRIGRLSALALGAALSAVDQAMAADTAALLPRNLSPWGMFLGADIVVKAVMIGLALASLATWTAWLAKTIELRRAGRAARRRIAELESGATLADIDRACADDRDAVARIIQSAAREVTLSGDIRSDGLKERVALRLERVEAAMSRRIARGTG